MSGGGSGELSPRSPSIADQRVKVRMRKLATTIPEVGCGKGKLKGQMLNVACEKVNVHSTELEGRIENLTAAYEKLNVESENLNVA